MTTHKKRPLKTIIEELQSLGYEVDIEHSRKYIYEQLGLGSYKTTVLPRGGTTFAYIMYDKEVVATATAVCSDEDNYNRNIGALIALGRARKLLERYDPALQKEERVAA